MTGRSDESLVRATLDGDQDAFNVLASRYRDAAFGIAFHHLGDVETARDAAQEALVAAFVDLPTLWKITPGKERVLNLHVFSDKQVVGTQASIHLKG